MTPRPTDLNELSKQIFADNEAKGFHDKEYSDEHYLQLVICELCEAVEADRLNKWANLEEFDEIQNKDISFDTAFLTRIKGRVDEELADAVIRLLDLAGLRGIELTVSDIEGDYRYKNLSFCENIFYLTVLLAKYYRPHQLYFIIQESIYDIENICIKYNIDLWRIVELKLEYNKLRPMKHGKEY